MSNATTTRTALEVMPPMLLCQPTTSEVDAGGVEVEEKYEKHKLNTIQ